jgi:hypothetical protein
MAGVLQTVGWSVERRFDDDVLLARRGSNLHHSYLQGSILLLMAPLLPK